MSGIRPPVTSTAMPYLRSSAAMASPAATTLARLSASSELGVDAAWRAAKALVKIATSGDSAERRSTAEGSGRAW